ncbi:MAG: tyrosine-type recombinase/integrase [Gammaproteobacteria bacterium]
MPLTDRAVKAAKPGEKPRKISDSGGLYIEVHPNGSKYWRLKYRYQGREKRLALGVYPLITLAQARSKRDDAKRLLSDGIDPSVAKKAAKMMDANTFQALAIEWYQGRKDGWAPSHAVRLWRRLEADVFPWIGSSPVTDVTPPILLDVVRRIESRGALDSAHRVLQTCGQVFRYGVATGRCQRDPSQDLKGALPPVKGSHFPAVTDPQEAREIVQTIWAYQGSLVVASALRLAPLVFVRPGELRTAKWEDIDLDGARWAFTASKTGQPHIVPLASQAVEVLRELHPLTGHGIYVFPSARTPRGDRPMSDNAVLAALRRMDIPKDKMTGHGFRAMARTILDEVLGFRPDIIEHQLAHAVRDPHGRAYNRTAHLEQRAEMMQAWADWLLSQASRAN